MAPIPKRAQMPEEVEGGVGPAGVVRAHRVMFREFPVKTEIRFVKQNYKFVHKCGFSFLGRSSEHAKQKPRNLESGSQNLDFSLLVEKFDKFRAASVKSENTFVDQLLILFHK